MKTAAKAAGLAVMVSGKSRKAEPEPTPPVSGAQAEWRPHRFLRCQRPVEASKVHVGPVRSGQQIHAAGTSLVVLGSVSPGAEVIADDSIHVYGALRGASHRRGQGQSQGPHLLPAIAGRAALHRGHLPAQRCIACRRDTRAGPYPARQ